MKRADHTTGPGLPPDPDSEIEPSALGRSQPDSEEIAALLKGLNASRAPHPSPMVVATTDGQLTATWVSEGRTALVAHRTPDPMPPVLLDVTEERLLPGLAAEVDHPVTPAAAVSLTLTSPSERGARPGPDAEEATAAGAATPSPTAERRAGRAVAAAFGALAMAMVGLVVLRLVVPAASGPTAGSSVPPASPTSATVAMPAPPAPAPVQPGTDPRPARPATVAEHQDRATAKDSTASLPPMMSPPTRRARPGTAPSEPTDPTTAILPDQP